MKVPVQWQDVPPGRPKWWQSLQRIFQLVTKAINGNIGFGQLQNVNGNIQTLQTVSPMTATKQFSDNIDVAWAFIQTPAVANTDFTINHNLGRPCSGFLVTGPSAAGIIYISPSWTTPFNNTSIILRCSVASMTSNIALF